MTATALNYRPDIDGLRAIAVSSVIGYHAFPGWAKGGFVGVDIFFVISGFLITSIILKLTVREKFSLLDFYQRRIRRIFPALLTVLVCCLITGWLLLFPDEMQQLGKHTLGANLFITNFMFWHEAGYFDTASELKPLLHLWSLSIEEQFYALWPVTLLIFLKTKRPLLLVSALAILSFVFCIVGALDSTANFYMPLTRIWELLCGGLVAATLLNKNIVSNILSSNTKTQRLLSEGLSLTGITLLTLSIFFAISHDTPFPGWAALLPVAGVMAIITAGPTAIINRYLLGNPIMVFVGLISYPLYLWHWPLLAFPKITEGLILPMTAKVIAIAAAVTFATATYYLVEKPLRHREGGTVKGLLMVAAIIALLGLCFWKGILQPKQSGDIFQKIAAAKVDRPNNPAVSKASLITVQGQELYAIGSGPHTTLYIGDSNMAQYWLGIEKTILGMEGKRRALLGGCWVPILGLEMPTTCRETNELLFSLARNDRTIDTVVISAQWRSLFAYNFIERGQLYPLQGANSEGVRKARKQLTDDIRELVTRGKQVYLILNIPSGSEFDPHHLVKRSLKGFHVVPRLEGGISLEQHRYITHVVSPVSPLLRDVAHQSGAIVLDPADSLCRDNWCSAVTEEGEPIYSDSDHLRGSFSYYHPEFIAQTLR